MRCFDRILLCLLTTGVCAIAGHLVLPISPAGASMYSQNLEAAPTKPEHELAICAVRQVVDELLKSDRFLPARQALYDGVDREALIQEYETLRTQMNNLREQYERLRQEGQLDSGQPTAELQRIQAEVQGINERLKQIQQQLQPLDQQLQQLSIQQFQEAYALVRDAAEAVAEDLGYDYVLATNRRDDDFSPIAASAANNINARPVLVFPESVDITLDVMAELNLD